MRRSVLLITLDRWPRSLLGLHGNPWIDTPTANTLAAEGAVFEQHLAGTFDSAGQTTTIEQVTGSLQHLKSDPRVQFCYAREEQATPTTLQPDLVQPGSWEAATTVSELPCVPLFQAVESWLTRKLQAETSLVWVHSAGVPEQRPIPEELSLWYQEEWEELGIALSTVYSSQHPILHPAEQGGAATLLDAAIGRLIPVWKQLVDAGVIVLGGLRGGGALYNPPHQRTAGVPGETALAEAELPLIVAGYRRSPESTHNTANFTTGSPLAEILRPGTRSVRLSTWSGLAGLLQHTLFPDDSVPHADDRRTAADSGKHHTSDKQGHENWNRAFPTTGEPAQTAVFQRLKLSSGEPALSVRTVDRVALFPLTDGSLAVSLQPATTIETPPASATGHSVISDRAATGTSVPPAGSFLFRLPSDRGGLHSVADQQPDQLQCLWELAFQGVNDQPNFPHHIPHSILPPHSEEVNPSCLHQQSACPKVVSGDGGVSPIQFVKD